MCAFYFKLFEAQFCFNGALEKYLLLGMPHLLEDPAGSQMWVAEEAGALVGSIAIVKRGAEEAQLRWFGVAEPLQGCGIGTALLRTAMDFCAQKGYTHVSLWTIDILAPACRLYKKFGFVQTETKPNREWADYAMTEEKWEYHAKG